MSFLGYYTVFDALLYPLDLVKSIMYADTLGKLSNKVLTKDSKSILNNLGLKDLYSGLWMKLVYNVPVLSGIYCTTQAGK